MKGTDEKYNKSFENLLSNGLFLDAKIEYRYAKLDGINATITLMLINPGTYETIAYTTHDTYLGNSYLFPPTIEVVTDDAIEGAVNKLVKIISKSQAKIAK